MATSEYLEYLVWGREHVVELRTVVLIGLQSSVYTPATMAGISSFFTSLSLFVFLLSVYGSK